MSSIHSTPKRYLHLPLLWFFRSLVVCLVLTSLPSSANAPSSAQKRQMVAESYLNLGRIVVKQEKWKKGLDYFGKIHRNKIWLTRAQRAESNYGYGYCLEQLGRTDDAIRAYNAVIAVYGSYIEWSSQALENAFELAYKTDDPEKKIKAYMYLRKILYMFQKANERDCFSGALGRVRRRLPEVRNELGLTPQQLQEIDKKLGITQE